MRTPKDIVADYLAIWNERDAAARSELIAKSWAQDATYLDPVMRAEGHAALDTMIAGAQAQFPGFVFRPIGEPDMHNDRLRFRWAAGPRSGGEAVIEGTDFAELGPDGRLAAVSGFLDRVPA